MWLRAEIRIGSVKHKHSLPDWSLQDFCYTAQIFLTPSPSATERGRAIDPHNLLYPALSNSSGHEIWKRDFTGSSGLFSIVLKPTSEAAVAAMLDDLTLFGMGYSWGGFESLVVPFKPHRSATNWTPEGPCLRFHIGLENTDDLIDDLKNGFDRMAKTP